ncbi:hypothetical protein HN682_08225 [Candidatus Peregrinibacteria bacterium]|jgi:hypothetical protein|nr:hypothetical protein [Candidatus Peregrinibacteria bacterium]
MVNLDELPLGGSYRDLPDDYIDWNAIMTYATVQFLEEWPGRRPHRNIKQPKNV